MRRFRTALGTGLATLVLVASAACMSPPGHAERMEEKEQKEAQEREAKLAEVRKALAQTQKAANKGPRKRKVEKAKTAPPPIPEGPGAPPYKPPFDGDPKATNTLSGDVVAEDFVMGKGEAAAKGKLVEVHYTGYLENGFSFDSSLKRNKPFKFPLGAGRVIKGWDVGVEGMKVGGKRRLKIPAAMGYGQRQAGKIPPGSNLIFTIELLSVGDAPAPTHGAPRRP